MVTSPMLAVHVATSLLTCMTLMKGIVGSVTLVNKHAAMVFFWSKTRVNLLAAFGSKF